MALAGLVIFYEAQVGLKQWQPSRLSLLSAGDYNPELPLQVFMLSSTQTALRETPRTV